MPPTLSTQHRPVQCPVLREHSFLRIREHSCTGESSFGVVQIFSNYLYVLKETSGVYSLIKYILRAVPPVDLVRNTSGLWDSVAGFHQLMMSSRYFKYLIILRMIMNFLQIFQRHYCELFHASGLWCRNDFQCGHYILFSGYFRCFLTPAI